MLNPNPYMILSGTLGFSAADLTANRLGVMTPYQRKMLINQRLRALGWPVLLIIFLALVGLAFEVQFLLIVFFAACLFSLTLATWQRYQEDFEQPVEMIAGKWTLRPSYMGRYAGVMNGQTFSLSKHLINAFNENFHYRLYYTPGTRTILSAEIV